MLARRINQTLTYLALILVAAVSLFPLLVMLRISLVDPSKFLEMPIDWFAPVTLQHYVKVWSESPFSKHLLNSLILSVGTTWVVMTTGPLAAFALAEKSIKKKESR